MASEKIGRDGERAFVAWLILLTTAFGSPGAEEGRVLWSNSRLVGSPEPASIYGVERVFEHLEWKNPMYVAPEPGTDLLWVVLQGGEKERPSRIMRLQNRPDAPAPELVLRMEGRLIYGLTFHPGYRTNGFVFVFSNGPTSGSERTNRISRFTVSRSAPFPCDPEGELIVLTWRSAGHDGGDMAFGRDGMLYIASGDGTSDSDTWNSGQDMTRLLAKLLRIDVDHAPTGQGYAVPADNPFVNVAGARAETWAYGFRNPWRMCVDPGTGDIWVGQNGQDLWETAHRVQRGDNIGWSVFEGSHPFYPNRRRGPTPIVPPTIEHAHSEFRSLTGGVVYYGSEFPELEGTYIYGDYSTGRIWGARHRDGKLVWHQELADTTLQIAAFRVDQHDRLLVVDHGGGIYRLVKRPAQDKRAPFPTRLSETGLFASVREHRPDPGLIPYGVNAPGWMDGAQAERFIGLPGEARTEYASSRGWNFTNDTALVQTLSMETRAGEPASRRRLETRVLLRQDNEWAGYSYRWSEDQSDAVLVGKEGETLDLDLRDAAGAVRRQTWRIPSRTECLTCHSRAVNYVLGLSQAQMNREHDYGGQSRNQLDMLNAWKVLGNAPRGQSESSARLVNPYDESADLDQRARAYLHVNCSVCHVEAGGGNAKMELEFDRARDRMNLIRARPQHDSFGMTNAMLVAPGEPDRSVLLHRVSCRGRGQMPPLGTARVDEQAVAMLRRWIASMKPEDTFVREWTIADFEPELKRPDAPLPVEQGKEVFDKAGCAQCHRFAGEGGTVGPDLTGVSLRLDRRTLLESILDPSKVVADEYATYEIEGRDGELTSGRIEREDAVELVLRTGSALDELVHIPKGTVRRRSKSAVSNMPVGMINVLRKEEILALLGHLTSGDGGSQAPSGDASTRKVAVLTTEYRHNSHADVIASRLLLTDTLDGKGKTSPLRLVSLYTDQVPPNDTSRSLAAAHGFRIFDTIEGALTLGTGRLAVEGVLLIAEHGHYPKSATGNTQYPKRRFWEETLRVFRASGRVVPVFIDKHLADNWTDAKFIYDTARELDVPLMAGSSLPSTWRRPPADVPRDAPLREIVAITFHTTDAYGFHALEFVQALAEQRRGGETGIQAVQSWAGDAVWRAFDEKAFDVELFQAAYDRLTPSATGRRPLREVVPQPRLFRIEFADGLRAHLLELNGAVSEWAGAWRIGESNAIVSAQFWTQEGRPGMHFTWLLHGIERMMLTGQPAWNVERTLLTSGALDALLRSLQENQRRVETPYLKLSYQPFWRWTEPPPPPPMRPWSEQ